MGFVVEIIKGFLKSQRDLIFSNFPKDTEATEWLTKNNKHFDDLLKEHLIECKNTGKERNLLIDFLIAFAQQYPEFLDELMKKPNSGDEIMRILEYARRLSKIR